MYTTNIMMTETTTVEVVALTSTEAAMMIANTTKDDTDNSSNALLEGEHGQQSQQTQQQHVKGAEVALHPSSSSLTTSTPLNARIQNWNKFTHELQRRMNRNKTPQPQAQPPAQEQPQLQQQTQTTTMLFKDEPPPLLTRLSSSSSSASSSSSFSLASTVASSMDIPLTKVKTIHFTTEKQHHQQHQDHHDHHQQQQPPSSLTPTDASESSTMTLFSVSTSHNHHHSPVVAAAATRQNPPGEETRTLPVSAASAMPSASTTTTTTRRVVQVVPETLSTQNIRPSSNDTITKPPRPRRVQWSPSLLPAVALPTIGESPPASSSSSSSVVTGITTTTTTTGDRCVTADASSPAPATAHNGTKLIEPQLKLPSSLRPSRLSPPLPVLRCESATLAATAAAAAGAPQSGQQPQQGIVVQKNNKRAANISSLTLASSASSSSSQTGSPFSSRQRQSRLRQQKQQPQRVEQPSDKTTTPPTTTTTTSPLERQQQQQQPQTQWTSSKKKNVTLPKIIPLKKWFSHHHKQNEGSTNVVNTTSTSSRESNSNNKGKRPKAAITESATKRKLRTSGLRVENNTTNRATSTATMATNMTEDELSPQQQQHHASSFFSPLLFGSPASATGAIKSTCKDSRSSTHQQVYRNNNNEEITVNFHEEEQRDQQEQDGIINSHKSLFQNVFNIDNHKAELQTTAAATFSHGRYKSPPPPTLRVTAERTPCTESPTPTATAGDAIVASGGACAAILPMSIPSAVITAMTDASSTVMTTTISNHAVEAKGSQNSVDLADLAMSSSSIPTTPKEDHAENKKNQNPAIMNAPAVGGFSETNPGGYYLGQDNDRDGYAASHIRRPVNWLIPSLKQGQSFGSPSLSNSMSTTATPPSPFKAFSPGNKLRSTSTTRTPRISNQQDHRSSPSCTPPPSPPYQGPTAFSWFGDAKRAIQEAKRNKNIAANSTVTSQPAVDGKGVPAVVVADSKPTSRNSHCNFGRKEKKRNDDAMMSSTFHGKHKNTFHYDQCKQGAMRASDAVVECTANTADDDDDDNNLAKDDSYEHNDGCRFLASQCCSNMETMTERVGQPRHKSTSVFVDTQSVSSVSLPFPWLLCNGEEKQSVLHLLSGDASSLSSSSSSSSSSGYRVKPANNMTEKLPQPSKTHSLSRELPMWSGGKNSKTEDTATTSCSSVESQDQQLVKKYQHYGSYSSVTITMRDAKETLSELQKSQHQRQQTRGILKTKQASLEWLKFADDAMVRAKRRRDDPLESSFSTHDNQSHDTTGILKTSFESDPSSKISKDDNVDFLGIFSETPFNSSLANLDLLYLCLICQDDDYGPVGPR